MPEPASPRPFRVLLRMQIKPGLEQDFESTWLDIGGVITGHPANRGQWLLRSAEEPGVFYIVSDWADEPRFREFEHSAAHLQHRQRLHPYRDGGSMVTMHVLHHLEGSGVAA
jgi:heme-degrading monooxygenase HmoA